MRRGLRVCLIVCCGWLAACGRPVVELELIEPQMPTDKAVAEDMAAAIADEAGIRLTLIAPPVGQSTLDALEAGYGDLAFASNDQPFRDDIVTIMPLYPTVLHIVVREELISDNFQQMLKGARIYAGAIGSASHLLTEQIVRDLSLDPEDVIYLDSPDDSVDVFVVYAAIEPERIPEMPGYRLLTFGDVDDIGKGSNVDRATLLNPRLRPFIVPIGTYGDLNPEPVVTVAVDKLLVARSELPEHVGYDLIRGALRMRPALSTGHPSIFTNFDDGIDIYAFTFPMHRGARLYIERDEPTFVERYSGVAEVLVTVLIGLVSGTYAVVNIYRIRRKNRIDVFYKDVFELRDVAAAAPSDAEREAAIGKIRALQKQAFDMLVDEKLAADESFRIFITLCNDAIRDLGGTT